MAQNDPADRRIWDSVDEQLSRGGEAVDARLVGFVRWYQQRASELSSGDANDSSAESDLNRWIAIGSATVVLGLSTAGLPGDAIMKLITALVDVEEVQSTMLKSIDEKATRLLDGPLRTAQLLLREAQRTGPADPRYAAILQQAWERSFDAYGLADSPQSRAVVQMYLGQVSLLLNRREDAAHWLTESYRCAREAVDHMVAGSSDIRVLRSKWSTAASVLYYPVGAVVLARKLGKIHRAQQTQQETRTFVEFVNAVAAATNSLSSGPPVAGLIVEPRGHNVFVVRECRPGVRASGA
ncbi:hypothetical protein [Streptomyces sp. NPDC001401]|uniref:hypothetical protein n=1 Tax=Streptomyces sp. NPDC001401 TaxID=3364570 RepID=UPI0036767510